MAEPREGLRKLVSELVDQTERELEEPLDDDTSLIQGGLLDSVLILELAEWIDQQVSTPIDLNDTDIQNEWDSIERILEYVKRHA